MGKPITRAEMEADRDRSKVRTQDEPVPQNMFQRRAKPGDPLVLDVSIPIKKASETTSRGLGVGIKHPAPPPTPAPAPAHTTTGGNGINTRTARRVTASDFLASSQTEKEGYGLYSYILFGARPESISSDRWRRYYEAIVAYLDFPTLAQLSPSVPPPLTNPPLLPVPFPYIQ